MNLPFDSVWIVDGVSIRKLSVAEFLAMDLSVRIRHVMAGEVEFRRGLQPVERGLALNALRQYNVPRK